MSEEVELRVDLSSTYWEDRLPGARVYINNQLLFEGLIREPQSVHWKGLLEDGDHRITIEMYGKRDDDTWLDADDNIIKDVLLNIDNIAIDDIDLDQLLHSHSEYFPNCEYAPERVTECVNLGWNGRWELVFSVPAYLWFLENF